MSIHKQRLHVDADASAGLFLPPSSNGMTHFTTRSQGTRVPEYFAVWRRQLPSLLKGIIHNRVGLYGATSRKDNVFTECGGQLGKMVFVIVLIRVE